MLKLLPNIYFSLLPLHPVITRDDLGMPSISMNTWSEHRNLFQELMRYIEYLAVWAMSFNNIHTAIIIQKFTCNYHISIKLLERRGYMYIICWWWSSKLTLIINAIGNTPWLEHTQRSYSIFRDYHLYIQNDNDLNMILHKIISIIKFIIPCVQRMWLLRIPLNISRKWQS